MLQKLDLADAAVSYDPAFLPRKEADQLLDVLTDELAWEQKFITMFGKQLLQPRLVAWYGDTGISYTYSGLTLAALPWTNALQALKNKLEDTLEVSFNSVLCNLYRAGKDSMGWHADDEPELGKNPCIASISLGEERSFHLKHKFRKELPTHKLVLGHGSLLVMAGSTQACWKHQLPKSKRKMQKRINLTFRRILS